MNKWGAVISIVVMVTLCYLLLLVTMPILVDTTVAVNTTLNSTSNMSLYPGTSGFLLASPWILFFVPAVLGIAAIVVVLRYVQPYSY